MKFQWREIYIDSCKCKGYSALLVSVKPEDVMAIKNGDPISLTRAVNLYEKQIFDSKDDTETSVLIRMGFLNWLKVCGYKPIVSSSEITQIANC